MKFSEARAELKRLAGGQYRSLYYQLTEYENGVLEQGCRVYIDPGITSEPCLTWEAALEDIAKKLGLDTKDPQRAEGAPLDNEPGKG